MYLNVHDRTLGFNHTAEDKMKKKSLFPVQEHTSILLNAAGHLRHALKAIEMMQRG